MQGRGEELGRIGPSIRLAGVRLARGFLVWWGRRHEKDLFQLRVVAAVGEFDGHGAPLGPPDDQDHQDRHQDWEKVRRAVQGEGVGTKHQDAEENTQYEQQRRRGAACRSS